MINDGSLHIYCEDMIAQIRNTQQKKPKEPDEFVGKTLSEDSSQALPLDNYDNPDLSPQLAEDIYQTGDIDKSIRTDHFSQPSGIIQNSPMTFGSRDNLKPMQDITQNDIESSDSGRSASRAQSSAFKSVDDISNLQEMAVEPVEKTIWGMNTSQFSDESLNAEQTAEKSDISTLQVKSPQEIEEYKRLEEHNKKALAAKGAKNPFASTGDTNIIDTGSLDRSHSVTTNDITDPDPVHSNPVPADSSGRNKMILFGVIGVVLLVALVGIAVVIGLSSSGPTEEVDPSEFALETESKKDEVVNGGSVSFKDKIKKNVDRVLVTLVAVDEKYSGR